MSWLNNITDLAGKAESLLNNIDQSAAVAISKASTPKKQDSEYDINISDAKVNTNVDDSLLLQDKQQDTHLSNSKPSQTKVEVLKPELQKLNQSSKQTDEALFKFLNSTQKTGKIKNKSNSRPNKLLNEEIKIKTKPKDIAGLEVSRNSSYDSLVSKKSSRKISDNGSVSDHPESNSEAEASGFPADSTASESEFEMIASLASKDSDRDSPGSCNQTSGSDLVVENKLLKTELTSLHHELTQVAERNKKMKEELQRKNKDLLGRCEDLDEELKVKKTQFSALNIKFLEVEKLFELEQTRTAQLKANNERILRDQSEGSGMHVRTIEELRGRLNETESKLTEEKQAHSQTRQETLKLKSQRDLEAKKVVESLQKAEAEQMKEKKKISEMSAEIRSLTSSLNLTKQELADYKQKAARILQSKERLIASLKGSGESEMSSSTIATLEISELKQERDTLKDDLHASKLELANIRMEMQDAEQQFQHDQSVLQQEVNDLRRDLEEELKNRQEVEFEMHRLEEEGRRAREEHTRSRTLNQSRLQDKDTEIERLRNQLVLRSQSTPQESELESRLRQLTEAVIQKQSLVETLSAEKCSLTLQLERMEGQVKRLSEEGGNSHRVNMRDLHDDDSRNTSNILFSHAHGSGVVNRVKKAASALDRFSIRLGVFLKRYPPARLFVLLYMGILHVWVMIVLLTYTPESHDEEFLNSLKHAKNL